MASKTQIAIFLFVLLIQSDRVARAKSPQWVEQSIIATGTVPVENESESRDPLNREEGEDISEFDPDLQEEIDEHWEDAKTGSASKYLELIPDPKVATEWLKLPKLVEPANPILVDPLLINNYGVEPIYYVNGPWRTRAEALTEAELLAWQMQSPVWLVYNPTVRDEQEMDREEYARLVAYLLFFGLPAPENLIEATFEGAGLVDIAGMGNRFLGDAVEAQWDARWFDWMSQAATLTVKGEKKQIYPHQHNPTTRQLASILLQAQRPITVVTHSQGGLIFRNACLIASALSNGDWNNRKVTWRSLALPLEQKPRKALLPGMVQLQLLYAPQDPFALVLTGRDKFATLTIPISLSFPNLTAKNLKGLGGVVSSKNVDQETKLVKVDNRTSQRILFGFQYETKQGGNWVWKESAPQPSRWQPVTVIDPGASLKLVDTGGIPIEARSIRYWVRGEMGWRYTGYIKNPLDLVPLVGGKRSYLAPTPQMYVLPIDMPSSISNYDEKLISVLNTSNRPVTVKLTCFRVPIDWYWDPTLAGSGNILMKDTKTVTLPANSGPELLIDDSPPNFPARALAVQTIKLEGASGSPKYFFPSLFSSSSNINLSPVNITSGTAITTNYSKVGDMDKVLLTLP